MDGYLLALQRGNERAFRSLFNKFYASLCLFAESFVKDKDTAADIAQDTFVKYWDKRADFDNYYKIKSFLYVVTRHACLNHLRNNWRRADLEECAEMATEDFFERKVVEEEGYRLFYKAVEELPAQMQRVIHHALDGLRNAEIAREMGISESAVHAYKKEAYKRLWDKLEGYYFLWAPVLFSLLDKLR